MRVIVSKIGTVLHMPDSQHRASPVGEQGETLSIVRRLMHVGHDVTYYGVARGTLPCKHVEPTLDGVDEFVDGETQLAHARKDLEQIGEVDCHVHVLGMEGSSCYGDNVFGARLHASDARYCAPQMAVVHLTGAPRIAVNNDPRSYLKLQEATTVWPECLPCALLDQWDDERPRTIGGVPLVQRSVYAAAENWWTFGRERPARTEKQAKCPVVAHAHIHDGCAKRSRDYCWQVIFSRADEEVFTLEDYKRNDVLVWGKGWEHFTGYTPEVFLGPIRPSSVGEYLRQGWVSPAVAPVSGFYTGKITMCAWHHCLPLLWTGEEHTADPLGRYVSLDDYSMRIKKSGDLERLLGHWVGNPHHATFIEELLAKCAPDFALLEDAVEHYGSGGKMTDETWRRYGGYRKA